MIEHAVNTLLNIALAGICAALFLPYLYVASKWMQAGRMAGVQWFMQKHGKETQDGTR